MSTTFAQMGFAPTVNSKSATPDVDGYDGICGGMPYHIDPTATPEVFAALQAAIMSSEVTVRAYAPPEVSAAQQWATFQQQALTALSDSDVTMLRCVENGVAVPSAWTAYRKNLREVVGATSGDPTKGLPSKPAYPAGT